MILKTGNKIFSAGSRLFEVGNTLDFEIFGNQFPYTTPDNGLFQMQFSSSTSVLIDYGNGDVIEYPTVGVNNIFAIGHYNTGTPPSYVNDPYLYPDGLEIPRKVKITFDQSKITNITITTISGFVPQPLRLKFDTYPNLNTLSITNEKFTDVSDRFLNSPLLTSLSLINAFSSGTRYSGEIPLQLLEGTFWTTFGYGDAMFGSKTFSDSNLDKIVYIKDTLTSLRIQSSNLTDLPENFEELDNLTSLFIPGNRFIVIPAVVGEIPSLTSIDISSCIQLTSLGDLSGLNNLTSIVMRRVDNLEVILPAWFSNLTKLKSINYRGIGVGTPGKLDTWVTEVYGLVTSNAPITGTSASSFRSMTIDVRENVTGDGTEIPSGLYQQPSGYVQGSNNGTPVSSLEKIWVMVNQYDHIWDYRTV